MENLIAITPNCYIVRTQAGFNKLLKLLHIGKNGSKMEVSQITSDENAFEKIFIQNKIDNNGNIILNADGTPQTYEVRYDKKYPIKYPCIISFQDETFEIDTYYLFIRYINDDLTIKDFSNDRLDEYVRQYFRQ